MDAKAERAAPVDAADAQSADAPDPAGRASTKLTRAERSRQRVTEGNLPVGVALFGAPLVVGMLLHTTFNLVDMFMVSRLENGAVALAALGICDMVAALATIVSNGLSTAAVAIIGRRLGARDTEGTRHATHQSLLLVCGLSLIFGALGLFGSDFIIRTVMQAKGEVADLGVRYLRVIVGGCYSIFLLLQLTAILRALGSAKTAAALLVGGNALNLLLCPLMIYGDGDYPEVFAFYKPLALAVGMPRLGAEGAAWATLIGRTVPVLVGAWLLISRGALPRLSASFFRPDWRELAALIRIGWPSSAQLVIRVGATLVFISLINANFTTQADQSALTAFSICMRLETMALFLGMGWGAAASSYVGINLGAGLRDRAKRAGWLAALYNMGLMLCLTWLYLTQGDHIVGFFDSDPKVLAVAHEYFWHVGVTYAALGVGLVLSQAMTGAGATLSSFVLDAVVLVALVVPAAILVAETFSLPRTALWTVILVGNLVGLAVYSAYYASGKFLDKSLA